MPEKIHIVVNDQPMAVDVADMILAVGEIFGSGPPQVATEECKEKHDGDQDETQKDQGQEGGR